MFIYLQPFKEVEEEIVKIIGKGLEKVYGFPYKTNSSIELPITAYFRRRRQWHSTTVLERVLNVNVPLDAVRVLGITNVDLFVGGLNFVFGEADPHYGTAIISFLRLNPQYYMLPPNEELFYERAVKESIHELGHTFGLGHCSNPKCIMFFSNTLAGKGPGFCINCRNKLRSVLK